MTTPAKPIRTASHRRQPIFSPRKMRERRNVDRTGHIEGHHICERQIGDSGIKQRDIAGRHKNTDELEALLLDAEQGHRPLPKDHWSEHDESANRADHQHLADGKAGDQPLAHCIVQRKKQIAKQHQQDAGHDQISGIGYASLGRHLWHPRKTAAHARPSAASALTLPMSMVSLKRLHSNLPGGTASDSLRSP